MNLENYIASVEAREKAIYKLSDTELMDASDSIAIKLRADESDEITSLIVYRAYMEGLIPSDTYYNYCEKQDKMRKAFEAELEPYVRQARAEFCKKVREAEIDAFNRAEYVIPYGMPDDFELEEYYGDIDIMRCPCIRREKAEAIFKARKERGDTYYNNIYEIFRAATDENIRERGVID